METPLKSFCHLFGLRPGLSLRHCPGQLLCRSASWFGGSINGQALLRAPFTAFCQTVLHLGDTKIHLTLSKRAFRNSRSLVISAWVVSADYSKRRSVCQAVSVVDRLRLLHLPWTPARWSEYV